MREPALKSSTIRRGFERIAASGRLALAFTAGISGLGAVVATWPLPLKIGTGALGTGDVWLSAWQLNWYHRALRIDPLSWADANIYFPYDNATALNDILVTHALLTLPAAWSEAPMLAHNLAFLGGIVLCGVCAHLLLVELTEAPWAASTGAVLFALTPFRFLHVAHLSVAAFWSVPLFSWALLRHCRRPSWGRAAVAAAAGVAVCLSSLYHAAYLLPIAPLILAFAFRRGPGGRRAWLPMLATASLGLLLLVPFFAPFLTAARTLGIPGDHNALVRFGADLSSLSQRPDYLGGPDASLNLSAEALLYPGGPLMVLAALGALFAVLSVRDLTGWRRPTATGFLSLVALVAFALLFVDAPLPRFWSWPAVALIWAGPLYLMVWSIVATTREQPTGSHVAIRLGIAGAALAFVFALGPIAHYRAEAIGTAPYSLLVRASSIFHGTRVPARFGGMVVLFLGLVASGGLVELQSRLRNRGSGEAAGRGSRAVAKAGAVRAAALCAAIGAAALVGAMRELPGDLRVTESAVQGTTVYSWLAEQPGYFGVLELPEHRGTYGAARYMLASTQHGKHLVNGAGRINPMLWRRFLEIEPWTDEFFSYIASFFPLRYVVVHLDAVPAASRRAVRARLNSGADGWAEVFRADDTRVYTVDRSAGGGTFVDRIYLRGELAPRARVRFSARAGYAARGVPPDPSGTTLDFFQNAELVDSWPIDSEWRDFDLLVSIAPQGPLIEDSWPRAGTLFTWQPREEHDPPFEIRDLVVTRATEVP